MEVDARDEPGAASAGDEIPASQAIIDAHLAAGRYAEAAATALQLGESGRAASLYEQIWQFDEAAKAARAGGDLLRALKNAVAARNETLISELVSALPSADDQRAAVDILAGGRRNAEAAALAEALGETDRAIDLFRAAHRDLEAARLLVEVGRDRDAGRLLEKLVGLDDDGPDAGSAHLLLGQLLASRLANERAARHLQRATEFASTQARAERELVSVLAAMGLRDAARDALTRARAHDPALPADIDAFLRAEKERAPARPTAERDSEIIGGRYRLDKLIGAGSAGRVFRATDEVTGKVVAIKVLHNLGGRGQQAWERFVREATIAGALRHPSLVEVYEFSADLGFLVMEYMGGGSLARRLEAPLGGAATRRLAIEVLDGLELAHQRGVIHRDIKPANIFFDGRSRAKLGDFGVAHLLDLGQTQTGGLIGTLAYMAPEQITGAPLTITADFYALGVTLFQCLTGRLPFLGPDFVAQHLGEAPPALRDLVGDLAPGWEPLIAKLLAKSPTERHESVAELRRALERLQLGDDSGPAPLVLGKGKARARRSSTVAVPPPASEKESAAPQERYQFETPLGRTRRSVLSRAIDIRLNRSVVIERFDEVPIPEPVEQWLVALARVGGPFLQRALSFDRATGVIVFEAPSGALWNEAIAAGTLSKREALRLLKRLARAVAPLHEVGAAHGAIGATTVVVDDHLTPTLIVGGVDIVGDLDDLPRGAAPRADVEAILRLLATATGAGESPQEFHQFLVSTDGVPPSSAEAAPAPMTGEALYAYADALEIRALKRPQ